MTTTKKRKPGRPKSGQARKININICLSSDTLAMLDQEAARLAISRSACVSQLILLRAMQVID